MNFQEKKSLAVNFFLNSLEIEKNSVKLSEEFDRERTLFSGKLSNHPAAKEKGDKKMKPKLIFVMSILPLLSFAKEFPAVEIVQKEYGFMDAEKFLAFLQGNLESSMFAGMSIAAVLLAAFAGGIALNLTPCVLPVIPVNLSIIGASDPQNRKTGILRACVYALGMILACGGVGLAAVLGGASLGGIASTWYFNLIAALIFVLLGLSMFGVLNVDLTKYQANLKIPSGTPNGKLFRLRGKGMPSLRGMGTGDLVVRIVFEVPQRLTAKQRGLLDDLAKILEPENFPEAQKLSVAAKKFYSRKEKLSK